MLSMMGVTAWGQQINGDFSEWEICYPWVGTGSGDPETDSEGRVKTAVGVQPKGWYASNVWGYGKGTGKNENFVKQQGTGEVLIQNVYVGFGTVGAWAPGYISLGTPWNTALASWFGSRSSTDGGSFGGREFMFKPDAISFHYKWQKTQDGKASFVGMLWSGNWNQKNVSSNVVYKMSGPEDRDRRHVDMVNRDANIMGKTTQVGGEISSKGVLVASYEKYLTESGEGDMVVDFQYADLKTTPEKINVVFASNDYFSQSVAGASGALVNTTCNPLTIKNVKLLYYHYLSTCKYDGQSIVFDKDSSATVMAMYDESKLSYEKKGVGATVEKSYDEATGKLSITVKGNDYELEPSSITTYTIQFMVKSEMEYTEDLYVTVDGDTPDSQTTTVTVQTRYDGKFNFLLKNFVLSANGETLPVGNIEVLGLVRDGDVFTFHGNTQIAEGDLEGVDKNKWLGPLLGEVPLDLKGEFVGDDHLKVAIDIDMSETIGQVINVHLGYTPTIATMAVKEGRQYGTFYAPFDVTLPSGVKAYTCTEMEANGYTLKLAPAGTNGTIAAKTAIIVEASEAFSQNFYNFDEDLKLENGSTGYLYGVAEGGKTPAPLCSYVLQTQNGSQKFYVVTEETGDLKVEANRCYLRVPADKAGVKAISFPGDATAIDAINALVSGKAEIYDLQGRRLPALQKGINVVNGRKVMVK